MRIFKITITSLIVFLTFIYVNYINYLNTENLVLENNAKILTLIHKDYPQLEEEIVNVLLTEYEIDYEILDKYNIDNIDSLVNVKTITRIKSEFIMNNIIVTFVCILIIILVNLYYYNKEKKEIKSIIKFINNALEDNYSVLNLKNNEGLVKKLENDIYKIVIKLKNQNEYLNKDKIILKDYISDISHQLKTPLTTISLNNDILIDKTNDKQLVSFLNNSNIQIDKMNSLVYNLLKLSKLDTNIVKFKNEKVNILNLLNDVKKELYSLSSINSNEIIINSKSINITSDYIWLKEAILNIIKNGIEHSFKDNNIVINVNDNPIYISIDIINIGETINKKDINNIFNRFYKINTLKKDSVGIGLAISKKIIENLNGDITVTSDKVTTFNIKLYKVNKL